MERVACLHIPDLPLAAALRGDPELQGTPLAIIEAQPRGRTQSPPIVAGWMRGMASRDAEELRCPMRGLADSRPRGDVQVRLAS